MKPLTEDQKELLKHVLNVVRRCIDVYNKSLAVGLDYGPPMCDVIRGMTIGSEYRERIIASFESTKPVNTHSIFWYDPNDDRPRLEHFKRIEKDILLYLKK